MKKIQADPDPKNGDPDIPCNTSVVESHLPLELDPQLSLQGVHLQGDQLNKAMFFWYHVKSDLFSVYVYSSVHWTSHLLQGTRKHGQVYLVGLYNIRKLTHQ